MSTLQQVSLLMFLIFLPMGKGVFCNLLLFNISSVHCISYISASNFVFMLLTVADLVKLNPEFDEFSLLFHITAAFVSIRQGQPTSIFGKYLLGRRFQIQNFRNSCFKVSCLTASPRIFEHLKTGIIAHFLLIFILKLVTQNFREPFFWLNFSKR